MTTAAETPESLETLLAAPRRVLQSGDTALVISDGAISVVRRGDDGGWRYAISLLPERPLFEPERDGSQPPLPSRPRAQRS